MTTRRNTAKHNSKNVRKLIDAAIEKLDKSAVPLTNALYESALKGHVLSAKLLVELATEDTDVEAAFQKRPLRTLAMRLAAEPQLPRDSLGVPPETDESARKSIEA
jgi:hypothetical protein